MDLSKHYIVQAIIAASNNLRLNSEKIESVAILREHFTKCEDIEHELSKCKKITELSKFGIKLNDIFKYINSNKVDFLKISDMFKEHSSSLVMVLSNMLDVVTPSLLRNLLAREFQGTIDVKLGEKKHTAEIPIKEEIIEIKPLKEQGVEAKSEAEELKEEIILNDLGKDEKFSFEDFQKKILKPIKNLEGLLNRLLRDECHEDEISSSVEIMKINSELAENADFKILANMHVIFAVGLKLILKKKIKPDRNVIESLRACLIVIVAVIKSKDVDITDYLNRAEKFGEQILKYK